MNKFSEIHEFGQKWRNTKNFYISPVGNFTFVAKVTYESKKFGVQEENCTIQFIRNGTTDGNINIFENGCFQPETHHLGFSPSWQKYKFNNDNASFLISGDSPKMGGEYLVIIYPNGQKPSFL